MTTRINLHLDSSAVIECTQVMGLPAISIQDSASVYGGCTVFLGDGLGESARVMAAAQLDQLAAAVLAARMMLDELAITDLGPDDDDDEPTDEPVFPTDGATDRSGIPADLVDQLRAADATDQAEADAAELVALLAAATGPLTFDPRPVRAEVVGRTTVYHVDELDPVDAIAGTAAYRVDFDGPTRTWEVFSVRHGEAIATGLTLSGAIRELEAHVAEDRAELDRNGGHLDGCEGSCWPGCPVGDARRAEADARAARSQAAWDQANAADSASAELVRPEPWGLGDGPVVEPVRQAHPMTENEARAAWGDR